jgi:hypothetical protein
VELKLTASCTASWHSASSHVGGLGLRRLVRGVAIVGPAGGVTNGCRTKFNSTEPLSPFRLIPRGGVPRTLTIMADDSSISHARVSDAESVSSVSTSSRPKRSTAGKRSVHFDEGQDEAEASTQKKKQKSVTPAAASTDPAVLSSPSPSAPPTPEAAKKKNLDTKTHLCKWRDWKQEPVLEHDKDGTGDEVVCAMEQTC